MGLLKQLKDMRNTLAEAPAIAAQAQQLAAAAAQAASTAPTGIGAPASGISHDDPRLAPIAGVDIILYARLSKVSATERLDEDGLRMRAAAYGIAATAWDTASAGWQARMKGDTALAVYFGEIYPQVGA